jgi:hypothetical protein
MALVDKLRIIEKRKIKNNFKSKYRRLNKVFVVKKVHVDEDQQSDVSDMYELEDVLDVNDED